MSGCSTTVLFLGSCPAQAEGIHVFEELTQISQHLRQTSLLKRFDLVPKWGITASALPGVIMQVRPQILHFSGHGSDSGELVFHGSDGTPFHANNDTIASIFSILNDIVRCAVINACYSHVQAELLASHVDVVVGMDSQIDDRAALAFSSGFYEAVGYGRSIMDAVELGQYQMRTADPSFTCTPRLHMKRGVDPARVRLAELTELGNSGSDPLSRVSEDSAADFDSTELQAHVLLSQPPKVSAGTLERQLRDQIRVSLDIIILRRTRIREFERELGLGGLGAIGIDYQLRIADELDKIRGQRARIRNCVQRLEELGRSS